MSELIQQVEAELLAAKGLVSADVQSALERMLGRNVDYGEVFIPVSYTHLTLPTIE